jgi:drug/metabolite transporter (DMT)-like permease
MVVGIIICLSASVMIGSTGFGADAPPNLLLGCVFAFVAALGWGVEGCIAGYGTSLIDYDIGIPIGRISAAILNLCIFIPILCAIAGNIKMAPMMITSAVTSMPSIIFFLLSGFFSLMSYRCWYKGNSMVGAALGMACNGTYAFWTPFFFWLILGIVFGHSGMGLTPIAWIAAFVMFFGILLIAVNPLTLFNRTEKAVI